MVWLSGGGMATAVAADRAQTLILGAVSTDPKKDAVILQPMADYAAGKMAEVGITAGGILMTSDKDGMVRAITEGKVDWVTDTPFPILYFVKRTGAEMLALRWKKGVRQYHSVFIARKDSSIDKLKDLLGKKLVLQDKDSSTAYYVPTALLLQQKFSLVELGSYQETVPRHKIGILFGQEDTTNQVAWMQRNVADAAAVSNLDWQSLSDEVKAEFRIFHESRPFPRGLEIVRRDLDGKVKARLKTVLLQAADDPAAADALKAYAKTRKFEEVNGAVLQELDYAKQLMAIMATQPQ
jgi:phosphonate transport system substrate-binding protein